MASSSLVFTLVAIPILLIVSLAVFQGFNTGAQTVFEDPVASEALGTMTTSPQTFQTAYPAKDNSITCQFWNSSTGTVYTGVKNTNCSITYTGGFNSASVTCASNETLMNKPDCNISYTGYTDAGYTSYQKVYKNTLQGMNLSSLLPLTLIALTVLGIIIGAVAIMR